MTNAAGQTATLTGDGYVFTMSDGAVFDNLGTFLFQVEASFVQGTGAPDSFNNQGTFITSADGNGASFGPGVSFNVPRGKVDVQSGTLTLLGGGTETGAALTIESATTLEFGGSTPFLVDSATTFSGAGSLTKDGPTTLDLPGNSPSFTGPTSVNGGALLVDGSQPGSAVSVNDGSTLGGIEKGGHSAFLCQQSAMSPF